VVEAQLIVCYSAVYLAERENTDASVFTQLEACAVWSHEILRLSPNSPQWEITSFVRLNI
jgi:hypothetical protein